MSRTVNFKNHTYVPNAFYDYMKRIEEAMAGDIKLAISPATTGTSAADIAEAVGEDEGKFIRLVEVRLVNTAGDVHEWFNGTLNVITAETTAGDGASAIADEATTITIERGVGSVAIEYAGTWAAADTNTVTIGKDASDNADTIMGYALTAKTSVDTVVA